MVQVCNRNASPNLAVCLEVAALIPELSYQHQKHVYKLGWCCFHVTFSKPHIAAAMGGRNKLDQSISIASGGRKLNNKGGSFAFFCIYFYVAAMRFDDVVTHGKT